MRIRLHIPLLAVLLTVVGCKAPSSDSNEAPAAKLPNAPRPAPSASTVDARPRLRMPARPRRAEQRVDKAEVRALVKAWRTAQNEGQFQKYASLYAHKLTGIRRTGLRTYRFDRKGWLAERRRMFKRKMTVDIADLVISAHARSAIVRFTQTWASAGFKDTGPKQLVVVRDGKALRIAREEMLESTVLAKPSAAGPGKGEFLFVAPHRWKDVFHVVLHHRPSPAWAKPGYRRLSRSGAVVRDVREDKLPAALRAWKGRALHVYDGAGRTCAVTIVGLALRAEIVPHFGTVADWNGADGRPRKSDVEVARAIWGLATGNSIQTQRGPGLWLVARLDKSRAQCKIDTLWARDAKLPKPVIWTRAANSPAARGALAWFRKLPGWQAVQGQFRKEGKSGQWDRYDDSKPVVAVFVGPTPQKTLVMVSADAGSGCGDFEGSFWAMWRKGGAKPALLTDPKRPDASVRPVAVFDSDGDGLPEVLSAPHRLEPLRVVSPVTVGTSRIWRVTRSLRIPFFDCGC